MPDGWSPDEQQVLVRLRSELEPQGVKYRSAMCESGFFFIVPPALESQVRERVAAELSSEVTDEAPAEPRKLEELTEAERRKLNRDVRSYIATKKPSKRDIASEFKISRQAVDRVERDQRARKRSS